MKKKSKFNGKRILAFFLSAVMLVEALASPMSARAADDTSVKPTGFVTWANLPTIHLTDSKGYYKMSDMGTYGTNGTNGQNNVYTYDAMHYAQTSRVMYQKRFAVSAGTEISVTNPVADVSATGNTAGRDLMYNVMEWNASGTVTWDSGWLSMDKIWTVGKDTQGHGNYFVTVSRSEVAYVTIIFKYADGNSGAGTGLDDTMSVSTITTYFPNMYLTYKSATATISPNGGTYNGSTAALALKLPYGAEIHPATPVRTHYTFAGWRLSEQTILKYPNGYNGGVIYRSNTTNHSFTRTATPYDTYTNYKVVGSKGSSYSATTDNWVYWQFDKYPILPNETITVTGYIRVNKSPVAMRVYHRARSNDWGGLYEPGNSTEWKYFSYTRTYQEASETGILEIYTDTLKGLESFEINVDLKDITITRSSATFIPSNLFMWDGTLSLTAQWNPNVYTVTLNNQSATIAGTSAFYEKYNTGNYTTADCATATSSITIPKKTGYTFGGYYTGTNGTGTQYIDASGSIKSTITAFTGNTTLYAYWTVNNYSIKYDANGGTGTMANTSATYGTNVSLRENAFTRTGYTFKGWATAANGTVAYNDKASVINLTSNAGKTVTLYAVWQPNVYTITLNNQSATTAGTAAYYEKYGTGNYTSSACTTTLSSITVPAKTGYTFGGYYTGTNGSGTQYIDSSGSIVAGNTAFSANTTLYAYWTVNAYTIKYDANGGSGTMANSSASYGTNVTLSTNTFTRTGYTFKGWATTASGAVVYHDKVSVLNLTTGGGTVTLYAVWTPNVYTITLDNQSATTAGTAAYYEKYATGMYTTSVCATALSSITVPKRTGYTFKGYYTGKNGVGTQYINASGGITATNKTFTADTVLYAYWTANTYTIKYNANGGTGTMLDTSATYGTNATLRTNTFTRTGYTFKGWATAANGAVAHEDKESILNLTATNGGTVTLYAVWIPNVYTITLNNQSATTAGTTAYYEKYGTGMYTSSACTTTLSSITVPIRTGYTFKGYYTGINGTGTQYINASGVISAANNTFSTNTTLYAYWTANTYTIKYNANGGTGTMSDTPATYGTNATLRTNTFTKTGYSFQGWATSANGAVVYGDKVSVLNLTTTAGGTVTLYAVWGNNSYKVTYNGNGGSVSVSSKTYGYGAAVDLSVTASRDGYKFIGWGTTSTSTIPLTAYTMPAGNLILYAIYTISVSDVENHEYPSYTETNGVTDDEIYLLVWIKGDTSKTKTYPLTYKYDTSAMVYRYELPQTDISSFTNGKEFCYQLIAYDNAGNYGVLYDGSGGTTPPPPLKAEYLQTVKHHKYDPITETWVWFDTTSETVVGGQTFTPSYVTPPTGYSASEKDVGKNVSSVNTFHVYYRPNTYTLTFHPNGGTVTAASKTVTYNGYYGTLPLVTLTGHTFTGWNTAQDGTGTPVTSGSIYTIAGNSAVFAQYKVNIYTVTLNNDNATTAGTTGYFQKYGTGMYTSSACTTAISTITKPTKTGYTFKGYYTGTNGTGTQYIDASGKIFATNKSFTADTILYAYWTANTYTITFDANGGTGTMSALNAVYNEAVNLLSNLFTRIGYKFIGWATSSTGSKGYDDMELVKNLTSTNGGTIKLYALWEAFIYRVILNNDDVTIAGTTEYYQKYDTGNFSQSNCKNAISTIIKPVKNGYTFLGFYSGKDGKGTQYVDAAGKIISAKSTFTANTTLYPKWIANQYTIRYYANGGAGTMADTPATYDVSTTLNSNTFTRAGYNFAGWATSATGVMGYTDKASVKNLSATNEAVVNLYAIWEPVVYEITLNHDGATSTGSRSYFQKYNVGIYATEICVDTISTITKPTKAGYTFGGYYTGKDGTGTQYIDENGKILASKTQFTSDTILYAYWIANKYTIRYHANGGTGTMADTPAIYNEYITISTNTFTKMGYEFSGWAISATGTVVYGNGVMVKNLTASNQGIVILYARWEPDVYQVTLNNEGATNTGTSSYFQKYNTGIYVTDACTDTISTITQPVKIGYTFKGYYTGKNGTGTQLIDAAGRILASDTEFTDHTILYAHWIANKYTIKYHANGGSGTMVDTSVIYDTPTVLEVNTFEKMGYTFAGWTESADGPIVYGDKDTVANFSAINGGIVTLYAVWDVNSYSVTYDYWTNGGNYSSVGKETVNYGSTVDLKAVAEKNGYVFVGWNTDPSATTKLSDLTMGNEPLTLYAVYKKDIILTLIEKNDGGTITTEYTNTVFNNTTHTDFEIIQKGNWNGWTNIGWTDRTNATAPSVISTGATYTISDSGILYALYSSEVTVYFDTNGSSVVYEPQTKERYYNASGEFSYPVFTIAKAPELQNHSFMHWQSNTGTTFVGNENAIIEQTSFLSAIWDQFPTLEVYDRYFTLEQAQRGCITQEELLRRVIGKDREDGLLENGADVVVKNYRVDTFTSITEDSEIEITYQASDSYGNAVKKTIIVKVTDTEMKDGKKKYVRFINSDFLTDSEGNLRSASKGGVEENSIWRKNEHYRKLLLQTMEKIKTRDMDFCEIWMISCENLKEIKSFTNTYGFGSDVWNQFLSLFSSCKQN